MVTVDSNNHWFYLMNSRGLTMVRTLHGPQVLVSTKTSLGAAGGVKISEYVSMLAKMLDKYI